MPICEKCGTGLPVGYEYCYQCGYPVRGLPPEQATPGVMPPFPLPGAPDDRSAAAGVSAPTPPGASPDVGTGDAAAPVPAPPPFAPGGASQSYDPPVAAPGYAPRPAEAPGWGAPGRDAPGWALPGAAAPSAGAPGVAQASALARTQVLAGWGVRLLAALIDYMIVSMAVATVAMIVLANRWGGEQNVLSHFTSSTGSTTLIELDAAVICSFFLYSAVSEVAFGATLGKRVLGLRVVAYGGLRASAPAVLLRNVTKALSCLFPLVGVPLALVMVAVDSGRQRIGDRLARTYVLRDVATIVVPGTPR